MTPLETAAQPTEIGNLFQADQLRLRIREETAFHSEVDRGIATSLLDRIEERFNRGRIRPDVFTRALGALDALIPRINQNGRRQIDDISISPALENIIRSRLNSREFDVMASDGAWGSIPDIVKKTILHHNRLTMEITNRCTVACPFCASANKGPIEEKMSFDSVIGLLAYFQENQTTPFENNSFALYYGTDVFDAKWKTKDGEVDIADLALKFWGMNQFINWGIHVSTAVPVGEELRVLRFADLFLTQKLKGRIDLTNSFRISTTDKNESRVNNIKIILEALHILPAQSSTIEISDNRSEKPLLQGKAWDHPDREIQETDILNINYVDDIVINPRRVDGVIMYAASNEKPTGDERFPIAIQDGSIKRYMIPHHYRRPHMFDITVKNLYPDPTVTCITIQGNTIGVEEKVLINPHRAFLRIIGFYYYFCKKRGIGIGKMTEKSISSFRSLIASDANIVKEYLTTGADNIAMKTYLDMFIKAGLI